LEEENKLIIFDRRKLWRLGLRAKKELRNRKGVP
jgi:hypothetical protein